MNNQIASAAFIVPITARSFDSNTVEVHNLTAIPERKNRFLSLCASSNIMPLSEQADTLVFDRNHTSSIAAILRRAGMNPIVTSQAEISSPRHIAAAFESSGACTGSLALNLVTAEGIAPMGTYIDVSDLDINGTLSILRAVKTAASSFNKPINVTIFDTEDMVPVTSEVESLQTALGHALDSVRDIGWELSAEDIRSSGGMEKKRTYATALLVRFPDNKVVEIPLVKASASVPMRGDVLIGPNPNVLPLRAGRVSYQITDVTKTTVAFSISENGKTIGAPNYKLMREQFEDLSDLYQFRKPVVKARSAPMKQHMKREREQQQLDVARMTNKDSPRLADHAALQRNMPLPEYTRPQSRVSDDTIPTSAPAGSTPGYVGDMKHVTKASVGGKTSKNLGLW